MQKIDPRLLATFDAASNSWVIKAGVYHVLQGQASDDLPETANITLNEMRWSATHK